MAQQVDYTGRADVRIIRSADLAAAGFVSPDLVWNKGNNYELLINDNALAAWLLAADTTFQVENPPAIFTDIVTSLDVQGDLSLPIADLTGGTADGGVIRRTHSIKIPWNYTQTTDPTDSAIGTAVLVDAQVNITGSQGIDGPNFATGLFGPRGVYELEGLVRYGVDMPFISIAPIGYADILGVANNEDAVRTITPTWSFMSCRQYLAHGGTVTLEENDTNSGGASFCAAPVYMTTDGGQMDGFTNDSELTGFFSAGLVGGNVSLRRRIGLDVKGLQQTDDIPFPGVIEPGQNYPNWTGAGVGALGIVDADSADVAEEIGVRIRKFHVGTSKIGIRTAHPIEILGEDLTHDGQLTLIYSMDGLTRTLTLTGVNTAGISAFTFNPTVVYEDNSNPFAAMTGFSMSPRLKNAATEARTLGLATSYHCAPIFRGDGAALSVNTHFAFSDLVNSDIINAGTVAIGAMISFNSAPTVGAGVTVTTRRGVHLQNPAGAGVLTTNVGLEIDAQTKGGTNIGIRNASTYVATPPTAQAITAAGNTISPTAHAYEISNTTGGSITLTSAPTIPNGQAGQLLVLTNIGTQNVVLQDQGTLASSNLRLAATTVTLGPLDSILLRFVGGSVNDWVQVAPVLATV